MSLNPDYFDSEYYDGGKGYHTYNDDPRFQVYSDLIVALYQPESVLDFGCAKGYLVQALRDRSIEAYGFDVSAWAVNNCPSHIRKYLSTTKIPSVDLVVSYDTWEHIPESELDNYKNKLQKAGKRFYFVVGTLSTPNWEHDASHITMHELDWWKKWWPEAEWEESK